MKAALSALLATLIGLTLAEVGVRFLSSNPDRFGSLALLPYDATEPVRAGLAVDPAASYLVFDADLGWRIGASRSGHNGLYHSNDAGERASLASLPGVEPWATAFGDSFTHGDDVADTDTWLARLGERGLPTVNAAAPGYGVDQAWLKYQRVRGRVRSRVVLIGMMADNIARHVNRYRPFITPADRIFFVQPRFELEQGVPRLVSSPLRDRSAYEVGQEELRQKLFRVGEKDRFFEPRFYETTALDRVRLYRIARTIALGPAKHADWRPLYADADAVDLTLAILKGFAEDVRKDGRLPVIVFLPERTVTDDVVHGRTPPTASFVARLKTIGAPTIDLTSAVAESAQGDASAFLPHYSPALSRAVADYIVEWKKTEKSLP